MRQDWAKRGVDDQLAKYPPFANASAAVEASTCAKASAYAKVSADKRRRWVMIAIGMGIGFCNTVSFPVNKRLPRTALEPICERW
jgi:hypothetical protein